MSSRFVPTVRYVDVDLSGKSHAEGSHGNRSRMGADVVTYTQLTLSKSKLEGEGLKYQLFQQVLD